MVTVKDLFIANAHLRELLWTYGARATESSIWKVRQASPADKVLQFISAPIRSCAVSHRHLYQWHWVCNYVEQRLIIAGVRKRVKHCSVYYTSAAPIHKHACKYVKQHSEDSTAWFLKSQHLGILYAFPWNEEQWYLNGLYSLLFHLPNNLAKPINFFDY